MRIGGLQKFSLIDYPGKVSCVIFTQGCNFRCCYCHNPELVVAEKFCPTIPEKEVFEFLRSRQKYLQGVVVSGGEATIHVDLVSFLNRIKQLGYLIKIDTNGSLPNQLKSLIQLKLVNYIAMDIKAPLVRYQKLAGQSFDVQNIKESIDLIINSGIKHQFRTTIIKDLFLDDDLCQIRQLIQGAGSYCLQKVRLDEKILDKSLLSQQQFSDDEFNNLNQRFQIREFQSTGCGRANE